MIAIRFYFRVDSFIKPLILIMMSLSISPNCLAHDSWEKHAKDIMNVFGFEFDGRKAPKNLQIKNDWLQFLSSDMIDDTSFHKKLAANHRGFPNLGTPHSHRILFHWAYDANPWNKELEKKVIEYCEIQDLNVESNLRVFKSELISEQKRRNKEINYRTESLFGFAHGGKDAKIYAKFLASLAYNIHILGDYTSDNTILTGLNSLTDLMGKIIKSLKDLDLQESKIIVKDLNVIMKSGENDQKKADKIMEVMTSKGPNFIKNAAGGTIYRKIDKMGFKFKK